MSDCTERHPAGPDDGLAREGQAGLVQDDLVQKGLVKVALMKVVQP